MENNLIEIVERVENCCETETDLQILLLFGFYD